VNFLPAIDDANQDRRDLTTKLRDSIISYLKI